MRILFATDLHGSSLVFEKVLRAATEFAVDMVLVGGDLSGKRFIRIKPDSNGSYIIYEPLVQKDDTGSSTPDPPFETKVSKGHFDLFLQTLEARGDYWHVLDDLELATLNEDTERLRKLWNSKIYERLRNWVKLTSEKLSVGVECYWTGGNDDDEDLLETLASTDLHNFKYAEHRVLDLDGGFQLISLGFSNETPFQTNRELTEEELFHRLMQLGGHATTTDKLVLNVHVPPKDCGNLDECRDAKNPSKILHVGSVAVRKFVEKTQPLVDFAGHVHEVNGFARIGRTYVFNPGSTYSCGMLQAFVVTLTGSKVADYIHIRR